MEIDFSYTPSSIGNNMTKNGATTQQKIKPSNQKTSDSFVSAHKKQIIAGGILASVAMTVGFVALAKKGTLGKNLQNFTNNIFEKFSTKTNKAATAVQKTVPENEQKITNTVSKIEKGTQGNDNLSKKAADKIDDIIGETPKDKTVRKTLTAIDNNTETVAGEISQRANHADEAIAKINEDTKIVTNKSSEPSSTFKGSPKTSTVENITPNAGSVEGASTTITAEKTAVKTPSESVSAKTSGEVAKKLGTFENPIQVEPKDISVLGGETEHRILTRLNPEDGLYYTHDFIVDSCCPEINGCGGGSSIFNAYNHAGILRDMQFCNGDISEELQKLDIEDIENYLGVFKKSNETKKEFIERAVKKLHKTISAQQEELRRIAPSRRDGILYRGFSIENNEAFLATNYYHCRDFADLYNNLKEGERCVLDWSPMCTSSNITVATHPVDAHRQLMRIFTPKGSRLVGTPEEVRLPSKAEFIFKGKKSYNGFHVWDFEYVLPKL